MGSIRTFGLQTLEPGGLSDFFNGILGRGDRFYRDNTVLLPISNRKYETRSVPIDNTVASTPSGEHHVMVLSDDQYG